MSYRRLDHWRRIGAITPSIRHGVGSGQRSRWSQLDADVLRAIGDVMGDLARLGIKGDTELVRYLWRELHESGYCRLDLKSLTLAVVL